ncbi:unnamed protein product [Angiostrongylus costaricensis]|uniref:Peptidase M12B domain-containing protein n=1 Tax=Angiostrongylus costaricensis TaxID=334426 RepID=A0A0R3PXV7_ANGCS|nr:unnamed protein product [Angiostrongylus costaricensis]
MEWRHTTEQLPTHDLAILVRHRYEGGVAYVNGVCKRTAVGITGFFPEAPYEYASVFFHELSHLLGLSHTAIANYRQYFCSSGFDNECSAQALVDLLPSIECLMEPLQLPPTVLALCGNGHSFLILKEKTVLRLSNLLIRQPLCQSVLCGDLKLRYYAFRYCINALCEPRNCRFIVAKQYLYTMVTFGTALTICGILIVAK